MEYIGKKVYVRVTTVTYDQEGMIEWLQDHQIKDISDLAIFESSTTTHEAGEVVAFKAGNYGHHKLAVKFDNDQIIDYEVTEVFLAEPVAAPEDPEDES
jgi:hypothetical protein